MNSIRGVPVQEEAGISLDARYASRYTLALTMAYSVWHSIRLVVAGLVTFWVGVSSFDVQQPADTQKAQPDSPAGKIAWQYDTGG